MSLDRKNDRYQAPGFPSWCFHFQEMEGKVCLLGLCLKSHPVFTCTFSLSSSHQHYLIQYLFQLVLDFDANLKHHHFHHSCHTSGLVTSSSQVLIMPYAKLTVDEARSYANSHGIPSDAEICIGCVKTYHRHDRYGNPGNNWTPISSRVNVTPCEYASPAFSLSY